MENTLEVKAMTNVNEKVPDPEVVKSDKGKDNEILNPVEPDLHQTIESNGEGNG